MRISKTLLIPLFCLLANTIFTQALAWEWGEASNVDLAMEVYDKDSTAKAVILYDFGEQSMIRGDRGAENEFFHFRRTKILDRRAIEELANVQVAYYSHEKTERLGQLKAQVIQADGSIEKVSKKDIFDEKINEYWSRISFSFPNVQVGSIIEYQYRIYSNRLFETKPWFFRHLYPVRYSEYRFNNNLPLVYSYLLEGVDYLDKVQDSKDGKQTYQLGDMSLLIHNATFMAFNVKSIQEDPYLYCLDDYRTNISFQLYEIVRNRLDRERVMQSWPEVAADLEESNNFGVYYLKDRLSKNLRAAAESEVDRSAPIPERIRQIHAFLRKHIQPEFIFGIYAEKEPDQIFESGRGDLSDMALAGISLLRHFDIPAYPLITSTRAHGKLLPDHAVMNQFNYVLAGIPTSGGILPVDFCTAKLPVGWVPLSILDRKAFLVDKEKSQWIDLPDGNDRSVFSATLKLDEAGHLQGEVEINHSKYGSYLERANWLAKKPEDLWQERLTDHTPTALMKELTYEDSADETDAVRGKFQLSVPEAAILNDDLMYLSPVVYSNFLEAPFKQEKRTYPIDFPYKISEHYLLDVEIPAGWMVEELPESTRVMLADKNVVFQYSVEEKEGHLKLVSFLNITKTHFPPNEYVALRELMDQVEEKLNEQIILRKK